MGFGDTAKKLQTVADTAEKLYTRINELREQLQKVRQKVDETSEQVDRIEHDLRNQRALLVAIAERNGIDAEAVLAESAIEEAEATGQTDTAGAAVTGTESGHTTTETSVDGPGADETADEAVSGDATAGDVATNDDGTAVTSEGTDEE